MAIDIQAVLTATVWKVLVAPGDAVGADGEVAILECMKMEIPVESPRAGTVVEVLVREGDAVTAGQVIVRIEVGG
jgi:biotin carboxyl carrier protein